MKLQSWFLDLFESISCTVAENVAARITKYHLFFINDDDADIRKKLLRRLRGHYDIRDTKTFNQVYLAGLYEYGKTLEEIDPSFKVHQIRNDQQGIKNVKITINGEMLYRAGIGIHTRISDRVNCSLARTYGINVERLADAIHTAVSKINKARYQTVMMLEYDRTVNAIRSKITPIDQYPATTEALRRARLA